MDTLNREHIYADVIREIAKIESATWLKYGYTKGDTLETHMVFTKKNFRYDVYADYKSNRKEKKPLDYVVADVKAMLLERLDYAYVKHNVEADDVVVSISKLPDVEGTTTVIAAIDKDITQANSVPCYNYNKSEWIEPKQPNDIEYNVLMQTIVGDPGDGWAGVKGIGKVGAKKFMDQLLSGAVSKQDYINLFNSEDDCLIANRMARMDQWNPETEEIKLWTIDDWCLQTTDSEWDIDF